jgi:hypothetical protein
MRMHKKGTLHGSDRDFLHLLADAAAANPFGDTYAALASKIAGCPPETPAAELYQRIVARLSGEVERMESAGLPTSAGTPGRTSACSATPSCSTSTTASSPSSTG